MASFESKFRFFSKMATDYAAIQTNIEFNFGHFLY